MGAIVIPNKSTCLLLHNSRTCDYTTYSMSGAVLYFFFKVCVDFRSTGVQCILSSDRGVSSCFLWNSFLRFTISSFNTLVIWQSEAFFHQTVHLYLFLSCRFGVHWLVCEFNCNLWNSFFPEHMTGDHVRTGEIKTLLAQTKLWTNSSNTFHQTWI